MSREKIFVGLEIGTSKICVVVADSSSDGTLRILGIGQSNSKGVRKGEIVDFESVQGRLREALTEAESASDVSIRSVYLTITGGHIESFNNRGSIEIPEDRGEINEDDLEEVKKSAREVVIPNQNAFLHAVIQHYYVDGQDGVLNPVGMLGTRLDADYHIVHGVRTRIQNTIRCVKEVPLEVEDVVFSPLASAQIVVDQSQKNLGVLVIDMGGGTMDFAVYVDGAVKQSGSLAIGGDHITNDISLGLRIPIGKAETLKLEEGNAVLGTCLPGDTVKLPQDQSFAGKEVEREMLNSVIYHRMKESFELLKRRLQKYPYLDYLGGGIVLTGGCSLTRGIKPLVEEIFGLPVQSGPELPLSGLVSALANPQLSTVVGLLKYAQLVQEEDPEPSAWQKIKRRFRGFDFRLKVK